MGDVSGKGVNAGIVMAKASTLFKVFSKNEMSPQEILFETNNELAETSVQGMFITMVVGIYDLENQTITWANAGHQPPLIRNNQGEFIEYPDAGIPVGIMKQESSDIFISTTISLKDKRLFIFTDGITEIKDPSGEMLGADGFQDYIKKHQDKPNNERLLSLIHISEPTRPY